MSRKQAVPARKPSKRAAQEELKGRREKISTPMAFLERRDEIPEDIKKAREERLAKLRLTAAKLYGRGLKKSEIARALADHLSHRATPEQRYSSAYRRICRWELQDSFRDLVYQHAVVKLDLAAPRILQGISRKAATGRVDAARLALELTGRHVPKGETHPTQIVLQMGNIPRPVDMDLPSLEETAELAGSDETAELDGGA